MDNNALNGTVLMVTLQILHILIGLSLITFTQAKTQTQAEPKPRRQFEVASIKPNNSGRPTILSNPLAWTGGRFTATNVTMVDVLVRVYPTRRIQMRGGPDWVDTDRFDIIAKADDAEGDVKPEQRNGMVQTLLEDRFKLKMHVESKETDVLALVPDNSGPKLQISKEGSVPSLATGERGQLIFTTTSMGTLANTLSNILQTPVVDGTNITGLFDFTLDPARFVMAQSPNSAAPPTTDSFGRAQAIVQAVQEQLGLKLQKRKATLDITFIDRAEKPTE
jgi:uncharacterized protein (TIGR03435 family)